MIQPVMTYAGLLKLHFSDSQLGKMEAIERRSRSIISSRTGNPVPSIVQSLHKKACKTVRQCIDKYICTNFHQYFQIHEHNFNTRNKGYSVKIPKVKLEFARQSFYFLSVKIYNDMPIEIRQEQNYYKFLMLLSEHFK